MTTIEEAPARQQEREQVKIGIIDADVHPGFFDATVPDVLTYLPKRWRDHVLEVGAIRGFMTGGDRPRQRRYACRWDTFPPGGGPPGSDPAFAREQLLDTYEISGALLNNIGVLQLAGAKHQPAELSIAYTHAINEYNRDTWFSDDPRWYAAINLPYEHPEAAVREIAWCKEETGDFRDRWKQILLAPDNLRPAGHRAYWPIYEACEHYGLPVAFHVLASNRVTPCGAANYYFEEHCDFALFNFPLVSSMIFEGVFDRFPGLKVALVELGWSWAVPLAWRLDHAYRVMGSEVSHLQRRPSDYLRDHFWYTTQPMEEPERHGWLSEVFDAFEASGMSEKLMFSSDYPHWDFDEPSALPSALGTAQRRQVLGESASALYGIDLLPDQGWTPRRTADV